LVVLLEDISNALSDTIIEVSELSGGDSNKAYSCKMDSGLKYFFKYNNQKDHNRILSSEKEALILLSEQGIRTPNVIVSLLRDNYSGLCLEWIDTKRARKTKSLAIDFCHNLKKLHSSHRSSYGLDSNNYIGLLHQSNTSFDTFEDFYVYSRLEPQLKLAFDNGLISKTYSTSRLKQLVLNHIPCEKPTLIHGDLWNGNVIYGDNGHCFFIDPSVSYCHREMDIAMMQLFGGFDNEVKMYNEQMPLAKGFENRQDIFQLYYLLVHLNMFGTSYYESVIRILNKYNLN